MYSAYRQYIDAINAIALVKVRFRIGARSMICIEFKVPIDRIYGTTFVTTAKLTRIENCLDRVGLIVIKASKVWSPVVMNIPMIGEPLRIVSLKIFGKYPAYDDALKTSAIVH